MFSTSDAKNPNNDYLVPQSPSDSVQVLAWGSSQDILVSGSWDNKVCIWGIQKQVSGDRAQFHAQPLQAHSAHTAPVLCVATSRDGKVFSGSCDSTIKCLQLGGQSQPIEIGRHDQPVKTLNYIEEQGLLLSGGWDKKIRYWDMRQQKMVAALDMPERVYSISTLSNICVIATAGRHVLVYDLAKPQTPVQQVQSPLKFQTRCVCVMTDKLGYAIGSIEGRVGIQYFQENSSDRKSFAFKCHREGQDVYAVNSISFHPVYGTFATAGSDGTFHFWDKNNKRRVAQFKKGPLPITSGVFNRDGTIYAYAYSYDWSKGAEYYKQEEGSQILLHYVPDKEIKPKNK